MEGIERKGRVSKREFAFSTWGNKKSDGMDKALKPGI